MVGELGVGRVRTVADYQRYAGVDFATATATPEALAGTIPADPALVTA